MCDKGAPCGLAHGEGAGKDSEADGQNLLFLASEAQPFFFQTHPALMPQNQMI